MNLAYKAGKFSIITIEITGKTNEKRKGVVNFNYAKFRTDKAYVVDIENFHTKEKMEADISVYKSSFVYVVGKEVKVDNYEKDIDQTCAPGIHYFKTKEAAEGWWLQSHSRYVENGVYKEWYSNGQLFKISNWKDKVLDGPYQIWDHNGQLTIDSNYKDGVLHGPYKEWREKGRSFRYTNYNYGVAETLY